MFADPDLTLLNTANQQSVSSRRWHKDNSLYSKWDPHSSFVAQEAERSGPVLFTRHGYLDVETKYDLDLEENKQSTTVNCQ